MYMRRQGADWRLNEYKMIDFSRLQLLNMTPPAIDRVVDRQLYYYVICYNNTYNFTMA